MIKDGKYYLGRVIKLGTLNQDKLIEAMKYPVTSLYGKYAWTFTDVIEKYDQNGKQYIFGKLSKFLPEGEITKVDTSTHFEYTQKEKNLSISSSPFVYLREYSGIAFLHVHNQIEQKFFIKRFREIINEKYENFFVDCKIEMISDIKSFSDKLSAIDKIFKIQAKISPPNPLFGPLWEPLKKYLEERNADIMEIVEDAKLGSELNTNLPEYIQYVTVDDENKLKNFHLPIGDAAILMAIDGYGDGTIRGKQNGETISIKTSESNINFVFTKDPNPEELYEKALELLGKITHDRHMKH